MSLADPDHHNAFTQPSVTLTGISACFLVLYLRKIRGMLGSTISCQVIKVITCLGSSSLSSTLTDRIPYHLCRVFKLIDFIT